MCYDNQFTGVQLIIRYEYLFKLIFYYTKIFEIIMYYLIYFSNNNNVVMFKYTIGFELMIISYIVKWNSNDKIYLFSSIG